MRRLWTRRRCPLQRRQFCRLTTGQKKAPKRLKRLRRVHFFMGLRGERLPARLAVAVHAIFERAELLDPDRAVELLFRLMWVKGGAVDCASAQLRNSKATCTPTSPGYTTISVVHSHAALVALLARRVRIRLARRCPSRYAASQ